MTPTELRACIDEYLDTLSDTRKEEWYTTERNLHENGLEGFFNYLFEEDIAKEARRQEYLKLKAEFEPTPN